MAGTEEKPVGIVRYGYEGNELPMFMMDVLYVVGVSANSVECSQGSLKNGFGMSPLNDDHILAHVCGVRR